MLLPQQSLLNPFAHQTPRNQSDWWLNQIHMWRYLPVWKDKLPLTWLGHTAYIFYQPHSESEDKTNSSTSSDKEIGKEGISSKGKTRNRMQQKITDNYEFESSMRLTSSLQINENVKSDSGNTRRNPLSGNSFWGQSSSTSSTFGRLLWILLKVIMIQAGSESRKEKKSRHHSCRNINATKNENNWHHRWTKKATRNMDNSSSHTQFCSYRELKAPRKATTRWNHLEKQNHEGTT